jgi:hypothetical protein
MGICGSAIEIEPVNFEEYCANIKLQYANMPVIIINERGFNANELCFDGNVPDDIVNRFGIKDEVESNRSRKVATKVASTALVLSALMDQHGYKVVTMSKATRWNTYVMAKEAKAEEKTYA